MVFSILKFMVLWMGVFAASSKGQLSWVEVFAIIGPLLSMVLAFYIVLINRKNKAEAELHTTNQKKFEDQLKDLSDELDKGLDKATSELTRVSDAVGVLRAHHQTLKSTNERAAHDLDSLVKKYEAAYTELMTHQRKCGDRYLQRSSYLEDLKAQREYMMFLKEMIREQAELIEKIRS